MQEGAVAQALGYALCEEMVFDSDGTLLNPQLGEYHIFMADEMPDLETILVQTYEPSGPYGAKAIAEIPMDGVAPAIANAIYAAVGVRVRDLPITAKAIRQSLEKESRIA